MAIYKPSNFYPHLQEIDLTQENTFSCQVNTDGAMVSAARLTISSEDNVLVYENLYQFVDRDGNKDPIENKGFMELFMDPYNIDNMISFGTKEEHSSDEVGNENISIVPDYTKIVIKNINFVTLTPLISYDERKNYCPYNIYNVKLKDSYCFGLKFVNKTDEYDTHLISFNTIDCEKTNSGYDITILYGSEIKFNGETIILENYNCYIVLLNNKDYTWDIKMYEHLFSEDIDKGTLVTDGYVTGSTKTVLWWDEKKQDDNTLFNRSEIKEDYYIEVVADENNSDLFEDQIKMGRISSGYLDSNNIKEDDTKIILPLDFVDVEMYDMKNIFLKFDIIDIDFIPSNLLSDKILPSNYFKVKKLYKQNNETILVLENSEIQSLILDILKYKKYYRRINNNGHYIYYDEFGDNKKIIYFDTEDEANAITIIKDAEGVEHSENIETGEKSPTIRYSIIHKQREKITWITENLGFDKNINKIEVEDDFDVTLNDGVVVDLYGGNNNNTNSSFFGVRDSDINVNDIYVRFPGYIGADFNGNSVVDNLPYYDGTTGSPTEIYDSNGNKIDLNSSDGIRGYFHQSGEYYMDNKGTKSTWDESKYQNSSMYGRNVASNVFDENKKKTTVGYIDIYNPMNVGTKNCLYGFSIQFYGPASINIYGSKQILSSVVPWGFSGDPNAAYGRIFFYIDDDGEWSMYATQSVWGPVNWYDPSHPLWQFPDYPPVREGTKFYAPEETDQIEKRYKLGKIDHIEINWSGRYDTYDYQYMNFYYYNSTSFVGKNDNNVYHTSEERIHRQVEQDYYFYYPTLVTTPESYCKLFKVTSYDYETGEFIIAGGLGRSILNTDKYEIWQRTASETSTNEYNITEIDYLYTRIHPASEKYDEVAYVGDTKILKNGIRIMNNSKNQIFIQPNVNLYSDEYNYPYLILDNYNQRIEFPYKNKIYDDGFTIQDRTINKLDGSQWLLNYNNSLGMIPKSGQTYKLYMDACKSTPSNWFYGRNIANIVMRVGEYNYIQNQMKKGYVKAIDFINFKESFNDITNKRIGKNCLVECVDAYFMATYDQLSVPIKRYRYKIYDSSMNLIDDSDYIYDNYISYGVRGLRNEEIYLLCFEMEDQLGYVYKYEEKIIAKYIEYNTNIIQLQLTNKESQGCIVGDFVTLVEAKEDIISVRDTYDENGNTIKKGSLIKKGTVYAKLCLREDFINKLNYNDLDDIDIFIYRRNQEKLLSFVCKINLIKDQIITGKNESDYRYGFIDYGVYNNEYYDYVVILKQSDLSGDNHLGTMEYTYSENRCKTCFNGWIIVDIEKDDSTNHYYVSDQVWNFKYNLESQDLTQNTSVTKWDTLGKYANVYIGQKNYMSSGLTCLLGDVGTYYSYDGEKFKENFGYFEQSFANVNYDDIYNIISNEVLTNNIDKYLDWKRFNNNGKPKLLKDYKGNIWIVQILENPSVKTADNSQEQVYTISFNWVEIMDWKKYPILGKNISFNRDEYANTEMMEILKFWDYTYKADDMFYYLKKINDKNISNNITTYQSPLLVLGRITLDNVSSTGILGDSYLGAVVLDDNKQFLSAMTNNDVEVIYNNNESFISPFKIKQENNNYDYFSGLTYLNFEQSLLYENNSIDFICCRMDSLKGVNIILTDSIKTARYAFAGTSITTDNQYQIIINTNNYINTYGMLDELKGDGTVTVKWGTLAEDPDLMTYAELYERYWDNDKIVLDCIYNFDIESWDKTIIDENGIIDGISYDKKIVLNSYLGSLSSVYIPKFYKDKDGIIHLIELSETFNI